MNISVTEAIVLTRLCSDHVSEAHEEADTARIIEAVQRTAGDVSSINGWIAAAEEALRAALTPSEAHQEITL